MFEEISGMDDKIFSIGNARIVKFEDDGKLYIMVPLSVEDGYKSNEKINYLSVKSRNSKKMASDIAVLERTVTDILLELGIPASIRGFYYLRSAVVYSISDPERMKSIKNIYAALSDKYEETPSKIERTIRYAITVLVDRGNEKTLCKIFEKKYREDIGTPSNRDTVDAMSAETMNRLPQGIFGKS